MAATATAAPIFRFLLIVVVARCRSESPLGYNRNSGGKAASQFGELLKPPPPPLGIVPVPFHGGRAQRHHAAAAASADAGYVYQQPPPPPPAAPTADFKFPAPFYKQYNFNFLPQPQPFTTTPSPSLFQKVSGWLFSSPQTSYEAPVYNPTELGQVKKDCNPCNLLPWIPVLRYNLGSQNLQQQNTIPTYGPPSPTAYAPNFVSQYRPQPFQSAGVPHAVYGPPAHSGVNNFRSPISTYGPPSPTHTIAAPSPSPPSSTFSIDSSSIGIPSSSYGVPSSSVGKLSSTYGVPSTSLNAPSSSYGVQSSSYGVPSSSYGVSSSTFGPPSSTYGTLAPSYETPRPVISSSFTPITPTYEVSSINDDLPSQRDVDIFKDFGPSGELQLPKVTHPTGFRNSYGEPITATFGLDNIPFPVSAAAESTKIKTELLPDDSKSTTPNMSLALANPAPFSIKGGRNIHTLQPVALPNLSVSPLPPIFNARPFRPVTGNPFIKTLVPGINSNNVNVQQSVPLAEFTHSIEYPPKVIKSTIIDVDASKTYNQTKSYRNIPNGFLIDEIRDISSQASEDHVESAKDNQDSSFETTGIDFGNDIYDTNFPLDILKNKFPSNHKENFADLRGTKDEDVDKYRTESNLQNIDSPLLYLKPSAPHKDHGNFIYAISTPSTGKDYEIYDEAATTSAPQISAWDESRTDYSEGLLPPTSQDDTKPKIVQIIVPYTTDQLGGQNHFDYENNIPDNWTPTPEDEYQGRKVPNTETPYLNTVTDSHSTVSTTEDPAVTEQYESERLNTQAILNDLYDVKEPPFDIIKLQHTIDDWTEQEYSKRYKTLQKTHTRPKYAKQIPDEYFTTMNPITTYFVTAATNYAYDFYDHEGASSIRHSVTDVKNSTSNKPRKQYNIIERTKTKHTSAKNEDGDEVKKPHIYTASSSFRTTTSTPAPWGAIQTSISPLTKEKVYVVTAKPWRDGAPSSDKPKEWYNVENFESKKKSVDNDASASDNVPFKSPRFPNRTPFSFPTNSSENANTLKSDSSYAFSKSWHQRINELESQPASNSTAPSGGDLTVTTNGYQDDDNISNTEQDTLTTTTAEPPEDNKTGDDST